MAILIVLVGGITITRMTRTAGALDPQSRTMQVEVQVPNHDGRLYAGMYGQVKFLLFDENAQNIRVGRDFGDRIEVIDGLKENTKVVMNPTDDLGEGIQVDVKSAEVSKPESSVAQSISNR